MAEARMQKPKAIVVTGASTGIGRACVTKAAGKGAHVFATVRKQSDADSLKQEFGDSVTPLIMDVTDEGAVNAAAAKVAEWLDGRTLFGLVNNAGMTVPGPLEHLTTADVRRQFDANFFGVHSVTRAFLPLLGTDKTRAGKPGRIVMISSVGGRNGAPFIGAYAASKHAIEGYSQSLRRELMLFGINVVVVAPGAVATPIWEQAKEAERFDDTAYGPAARRISAYMTGMGAQGLPPSAIGDVVWGGLTKRKPPYRVTILRNKFQDYTLPRLLPPRFVDGIIAKRLGYFDKE